MSRIGKYPVKLKEGVTATLNDNILTVRGKLGEQTVKINEKVKAEVKDNTVVVTPLKTDRFSRSIWGTMTSLIDNAVTGVAEGYVIEMQLNGVGYKVAQKGNALDLALGYSHNIEFPLPQGVKAEIVSPTEFKLTSSDKKLVGQVAAEIKKLRPPEPYKGKGIKYKDEIIRRKEGKKK